MINVFRKTKWRISYIEGIRPLKKNYLYPKKSFIVTAKTIEEAREQFYQFIGDKAFSGLEIRMLP